ncbi:DNA alkylation repair protein [Nocardioides cavernaquae]|uniref:DNA alkylation repair protein n=1 Tax=Nocardioides cavernaquae TaxID=2321396 RepID=A0A3A5HAU3_9ACTN|nr:DNA alkylation repair protein [Nocardioides cavernaquae]RJS46525.1 DNA alkylation repair protein [Nocardioides cavernaquae]
MTPADLVAAVRGSLVAAADPSLAPAQQAYMKSAMPFLGVRGPEVRRLTRAAVREVGVRDGGALLVASRELWDNATHREERYAASELLSLGALKGDWSLVPHLEHIARTGAWWDHVDGVSRRVADLHDAHPEATAALVRTWSLDDDFWLRRLAIISQLGRGDRTDRDLLAEVIGPSLTDREFFLRKAIGWSLRDLAKTDPDWVLAYVGAHELSPLSRREALKHIAG